MDGRMRGDGEKNKNTNRKMGGIGRRGERTEEKRHEKTKERARKKQKRKAANKKVRKEKDNRWKGKYTERGRYLLIYKTKTTKTQQSKSSNK